jgi:DNA repair protein RecO (recombination protein O)
VQRVYKAHALVLKRIAIGETDKVVTLYTREWGKVRAIAKGARRPTSRLAGATELLTYSRVVLAVGQNLDVLSQAEVREAFLGLRQDLLRIGYASYLLELTDAATAERQPNAELFDLLLSALYVIERSDAPDLGARMFELKGLRLLGYEPHLDRCVRDRAEFVGEGGGRPIEIAFSAARGGAVCARCAPETPGAVPLSQAALGLMRELLATEPQAVPLLPTTEEQRAEIARHLVSFVRARIDAPLRSLSFIDEVHATTAPSSQLQAPSSEPGHPAAFPGLKPGAVVRAAGRAGSLEPGARGREP